MINKILIFLGYRSNCCKAPTFEPRGWDRLYCTDCGNRLVQKWWYRSVGVMAVTIFILLVGYMLISDLNNSI